jgi:glycosyltransferase involved in cell wall biosynthesis
MTLGNIYYFCPNTQMMFGGIRKIYEHVDILNKLGFSAYIVHSEFGMRCEWFQNKTPIVYADAIYEPLIYLSENGESRLLPPISKDDILVIPEGYTYQIAPYIVRSNQYFVIFNQNPYLTFLQVVLPKIPFYACEEHKNKTLYYNKNLLATIAVSEDTISYLKFTYPHLDSIPRIHIAPNGLFTYGEKKKKQIAFMPRKHKSHSLQVVNILFERNNLKEWIFAPIDGLSEVGVAEILRESALFMSFSEAEGLGLPPLEAMACGCIVIGYHGQGGQEFLKEPYAYPINESEIVEFAKTVEKIALDYDANPKKYVEQGRLASDFIHAAYSQQKEENDLKNAWDSIIERHANARAHESAE